MEIRKFDPEVNPPLVQPLSAVEKVGDNLPQEPTSEPIKPVNEEEQAERRRPKNPGLGENIDRYT